MTAVTIQTGTADIDGRRKTIENIYRMLGLLSEKDRQSILHDMETTIRRNESDESYTIRIDISTGE